MYLGRTLDEPSRYFVFPKRVFLKIIDLYKSLSCICDLSELAKKEKRVDATNGISPSL